MKNWQKLKNDPKLRKNLLIREQVIDGIREYFKTNGFHEVETPLLVKYPGTEPYLEVFETELRVQNHSQQRGFLLTSPELAMKKILSAGFGSIFQICKSFRNEEGLSSFHNPEFTILEWYRINADYTDVMNDFEGLMLFLLEKLGSRNNVLTYQGKEYNLSQPWLRISVAEAFEKFAGIDTETLLTHEKLVVVAQAKGYSVNAGSPWEEVYNLIFLNEVEPHLGQEQPTFLYDYPASQAALSKRKADDPRFAERFELYLAGLELGNAFTELTDSVEQRSRMEADLDERQSAGKTDYGIDDDFINCLEFMPETGGIAVGVDRLVMLFADAASLKDTLFFPVEDVFDFSGEE